MTSQEQEILNRMQRRAEESVAFTAAKYKLRLDYTDASIPRVEHVLHEIHKEMGLVAQLHRDAIANFGNNFGAYIGEVLRRKHGGQWRVRPPIYPEGMEGLDLGGTMVGPLVRVFQRITKGPKYSIETFYKEANAILAQKAAAPAPPPPMPASADTAGGHMRKLAGDAISEAKERFNIQLDYSETSLELLDQVLLEYHNLLTDKVPASKKLQEGDKFLLKLLATPLYVGYLTEVFCKTLGAEWQTNVPGCPPEASRLTIGGKLLEVTLKGQAISLPQLIVNCMNDPQHWSAKNYFLDVKRTYQVDSAMSNAASFDDQMAVCAKEAVAIAHDRYGITLDFSEASVKELEAVLSGINTSLPKPGDPARPTDQWITSVAVTFGAYLGEIFRKNLGGNWLQQNPTAPGSLPAINVRSNILTPCRKVLKRILEGPGENVAFFYNAACQIIREGHPSARK